jgi:hypothetical protein
MHTSQDALELRYRNQVEFGNKKRLDHGDGLSGNVRKTEILVWILVVMLVVATVTAFCVLWSKAGGTANRVSAGLATTSIVQLQYQ